MGNDFQKGMFIYPWDIASNGIEKVIEDFKEAGCNTLVVNSSYHQGRFFHPEKKVFQQIKQSAISFTPDRTRYKRIQPLVHKEMAEQRILEQARNYCAQEGIDFVTWWVGLHNSSQGEQHPDLCVQNIWGDRYTFALCPSQKEVQHYIAALFEDTLVTVRPQRIITEAISFLPMEHGAHHELILLNLSASAKWLLSLCFCDACCQQAEAEGVDSAEVQKLVRRLVEERVDADIDEDANEIAHLLLEYPVLYAYEQVRMSTVANLVQSLSTIAKKYAVALDYMPSSTGIPANQAFLEGASLKKTVSMTDRFLALGYTSPTSTAHTLRTVSHFAPHRHHAIALTLHAEKNPTKASLLQHIEVIGESPVNAVYYYNYGLLNKRRKGWIKEANAYLDQMKTE